MAGPIYALNLFNVADRAESRRSSKEVKAHGGHAGAGIFATHPRISADDCALIH